MTSGLRIVIYFISRGIGALGVMLAVVWLLALSMCDHLDHADSRRHSPNASSTHHTGDHLSIVGLFSRLVSD